MFAGKYAGFHGMGQEGTHFPSGSTPLARDLVSTQDPEGVSVIAPYDGLDLFRLHRILL